MTIGQRIVRLILLSMLSPLIGFGAQETLHAEDAFDMATAAVVGLSLLLFVWWSLRPRRNETAWLEAELLVVWGAFLLTWVGNDGIARHEAIDLLPVGYVATALCLGGCHRLACRLYAAWRADCGYCLLGLREHRCPECGRPFRLEELGVNEEELQPAMPAAHEGHAAR
jgi:hypothetical protein